MNVFEIVKAPFQIHQFFGSLLSNRLFYIGQELVQFFDGKETLFNSRVPVEMVDKVLDVRIFGA